jgi:hypothetical protein
MSAMGDGRISRGSDNPDGNRQRAGGQGHWPLHAVIHTRFEELSWEVYDSSIDPRLPMFQQGSVLIRIEGDKYHLVMIAKLNWIMHSVI